MPDAPPCPLCGAAAGEPNAVAERDWTYHRCGGCDLLFLHPMPDPASLEHLYACHEGQTFNREADRSLTYERTLEARLRWKMVSRHLRPGGRIIELGCGGGHFLALARDAGHPVLGFELGNEAVGHAREAFGLDVRNGTLDGTPEPADAMVWFNVLSHLPEPERTLERAHAWLRPDGLLVLETGNVGELPAEKRPPLGAPEHVLHYGERSIRRLLDRAGFEIAAIERRNVEWQRSILGWRRPRAASGGGNGAAAPKPSRWRRPAAWVLLNARYRLGRLGADARHFCTLFVFARRRP